MTDYRKLLDDVRETTAQELARGGYQQVWSRRPVPDRTGTPSCRPMVYRKDEAFIPAYSAGHNHILFEMLITQDLESATVHAKEAIQQITGVILSDDQMMPDVD